MRRALCRGGRFGRHDLRAVGGAGEERTAASGERGVPVTTTVYQPDEQSSNVRLVDYGYRYGYRTPYYRYGYRYPSYGYDYRYPSYSYRYPSYSYRYPSYGYRNYGYGYPNYGYPGYRYGYRPGVSFGFRF